MNASSRTKSISRSALHCGLIFIPLAVYCLAFSPAAQAVLPSPTPDGGYAGNNTAEGTNALFNVTSGTNNAAIGFRALFKDTSGADNTATGAQALFNNTTGNQNTANGYVALSSNTTGGSNTATGSGALRSNTTASHNTATGYISLYNNTTGNFNVADGDRALYSNSTGPRNSATGYQALGLNTTGSNNAANGYQALYNNTTGSNNTAIGVQALYHNTTNNINTAVGSSALFGNITGGGNTAVGDEALASATGSDNTAVGLEAGILVSDASGVICIGSVGENVSNSCFIGNIRGVTTTQNDAMPVYVDSHGQLGTASSSRRYKTDIKPIDKTSEAILALKPVSFRYKVHKDTTPQFGLIAEDVATVNPDLVIYDADRKPFTVRYDAVNAMLLNEFLKAHRKMEQQEATIAQQQKRIDALTERLDEQASQIQKVSAQLELSKPASQIAASNQ